MADRVFVHIGAPKTWTTRLQQRIVDNAPAFAARGLTYPVSKPDGHFLAALDLIQESWAGELDRAHDQWSQLASTVRDQSGDVLVSHEILAAARPDYVRRAFESFGEAEVHIVLTVRDLARQIPAEWQERVRHRRPISFADFSRRVVESPRIAPDLWFWRVQSVPDVLGRWSNGLVPDHVHVVTVPPAGAPPDLLWDRFLTVLGITPSADFVPAGPEEPPLGIAETVVLRRLNRLLGHDTLSRATYVPIVRELIARDVLAHREVSPPPVLPADLWPFVDEVAAEWREWIEGAGVHVVGDLDDLSPAAPQDEVPDPDAPAIEDVADAAIEALAGVLLAWDRAGHDHEGSARRYAAAVRRLRRRHP